MIFLSFVLRYSLENFLAITITIGLEITDLYFDKHSRFRNKRTDLLFALSVLITVLVIVAWTIALIMLYIRIFKISRKSFMYSLIVDLKLDKGSLLVFYSCFFIVRIIVTVLVFVSYLNIGTLTLPCWGTAFIVCLIFSLLDYKPYDSCINNFTHIYSQIILLMVLMTGTIMSKNEVFKSQFKP